MEASLVVIERTKMQGGGRRKGNAAGEMCLSEGDEREMRRRGEILSVIEGDAKKREENARERVGGAKNKLRRFWEKDSALIKCDFQRRHNTCP